MNDDLNIKDAIASIDRMQEYSSTLGKALLANDEFHIKREYGKWKEEFYVFKYKAKEGFYDKAFKNDNTLQDKVDKLHNIITEIGEVIDGKNF